MKRVRFLGPLLVLAGCGQGDTLAAAEASQSPAARTVTVRSGTDDMRHPTGAKPLSETDRLMLETAAKACKSPGSDGYVAFFDAFIRSEAVRRKYSARTISIIRRDSVTDRLVEERESIPAVAYRDFPIKMVDYYRKPVRPVRTGDDDEYVKVEFNQSQSNQISVEWTRVHYDGKSDGGDDLGNAFDLDGRPYDPLRRTDGQLLFDPTDDCWQLVTDIRHEHPRAPANRP